ncbi:hypothetical protein LEP1GSC052_0086 [Leptospira phage vb_LkmZ_Bejolso9-LE1]|nr:hypothetical protein LEP1GSC052_0086 [Leptospira phage vb_LkmZ_Bejolso9-LE1]
MENTKVVGLEKNLLLGRGSNSFSHSLLVALCREGYDIQVIDCAIRFKAYSVAEATKGFETFVLHQIQIQRAFTPYQLLDFMNTLLDSEEPEALKARLFIFLAPSKQFFDGDVKKDERITLLDRLVEKFVRLKENGFRFLISESIQKSDPIYQSYLQKLSKSIGTVVKEISAMEVPKDGTNSYTLFTRD